MNVIETPQSRVRAGVAWRDITPPVGIYHRMWGAALHDRSTGVHRPLEAALLWIAPENSERETNGAGEGRGAPQLPDARSSAESVDDARLIVTLDHCILDRAESDAIRAAIAARTGLLPQAILVALSHTHGSGWMSRTRAEYPGGELIGPYLDRLIAELADAADEARRAAVSARIVYGLGRCDLAAYRDRFDTERGHPVCGFDPTGPADDTLVVARVDTADGTPLATIVNYACHPTTLAWDNTLLSPDWVGAMRQTIRRDRDVPCLFLQGASGELGPRDGFVGDVAVADRNGRRVGHAAAAVLESMPAAETRFEYAGAVLSGTWIGTWAHRPIDERRRSEAGVWNWRDVTIDVPYREDLPTIDETERRRAEWAEAERRAAASGDEREVRRCRAEGEQMTRQLARLRALAPGSTCPITVSIGRVGDAIWIFLPGEFYQKLQLELRRRLSPHPVLITTLTGDWQPGYFPVAEAWGKGIYQEVIAVVACGSLEQVLERTTIEALRLVETEERC